VTSDAALLQRIVGNLLGNAIRYTAQGGVVVGCRRRQGLLHIEVWDSGIGIPADQQQAVFNEFYQLAPRGSLRGDGLGLGLAIVARLCALLGHGVTVRSQPGRGSCFRVSLPLAPATPPLGAPAPAVAPVPDLLRHRRVVVIDNDDRVLDSTGGLLRAWGCEVVTARSVEQALSALAGQAPDLVMADFHLDDGQDGVAAVARLRQLHGPALPAFLVSGDVSPATRQRAADSGLPLLDKPVPPARLRALASRLLLGRGSAQPARE
jgi:CheY-like chemotaxis protein